MKTSQFTSEAGDTASYFSLLRVMCHHKVIPMTKSQDLLNEVQQVGTLSGHAQLPFRGWWNGLSRDNVKVPPPFLPTALWASFPDCAHACFHQLPVPHTCQSEGSPCSIGSPLGYLRDKHMSSLIVFVF